jgi:hypothetical protein
MLLLILIEMLLLIRLGFRCCGWPRGRPVLQVFAGNPRAALELWQLPLHLSQPMVLQHEIKPDAEQFPQAFLRVRCAPPLSGGAAGHGVSGLRQSVV